jgi:transposase-like protein
MQPSAIPARHEYHRKSTFWMLMDWPLLSAFTQAVSTCYPNTKIPKCILYQIRNSTRYVSYKDLKKVTANLKPIYKAVTEDLARPFLKCFT